MGENGSGKTTVVETLLGRLPLAAGTRRLARAWSSASWRKIVVCSTRLPPWSPRSRRPPVSRRGRPGRNWQSSASTRDAATRPPASLSPGERTRAELAAFAARGVNFLVLDEPTNHLDLPAIEQLEDALRSYSGTLLLVSHDRRMLEAIELTRRVLLPSRDQEFRGLVDER